MANNLKLSEELKKELIKAQSAEQVTEIVKADGQEISTEDAEQLWQEIAKHNQDAELSADELEVVSGGADRDWLTDGCAATVEVDHGFCGSNDYCNWWDVTYDHEPIAICKRCGGIGYETGTWYYTKCKCSKCGFEVGGVW